MGLGDAAEAFGPVLTLIGSLVMLGRQVLSGRLEASAPAALPEDPVERHGASIMVVVHVHLPCEGHERQPGELPQ